MNDLILGRGSQSQTVPITRLSPRGVNDGGGDSDELIDFQNPPDLREEPMKQSEIPAGYANDGGQTFFVEALYGQMNAFRAPTSL